MSARTAIIVVTHFSGGHLGDCLDSITAASIEQLDTIVVDNNTTDGSIREVVAEHENVQLLETGENLGYGRAVNYAAAQLSPDIEWILVANPDTVFSPGSVDALLSAARLRADAGSLGPRILNSDGSVYPSARALPSLRTGVGHALFARLWPKNPWTAGYVRSNVYSANSTEPVEAGWLSGACVLVRRTAFDEVGGFDPRYFMYFEDVDLGKRLGGAGWTNLHVPASVVTHAGGQSTKRYSKRMLIAHHQSAYQYLAELYHPWYLWPLRVALRFGLFVRSHIRR